MNEFFGDLRCDFCGGMPVGVMAVRGPTPWWLPKFLANRLVSLMRKRVIV